MTRLALLWLWLLSSVWQSSTALKSSSTSSSSATTATLWGWRGGASSNVTVENYVQQVEKRDAEDRQNEDDKDDDEGDETPKAPGSSASHNGAGDDNDDEEDESVVGVKSHHHHHKKSNAVGDPDGDDSSDSEDSEDWDEFEDELEELVEPTTQVQVEVELVEEEFEDEPPAAASTTATGGGVGIRLGRLHRNRKSSKHREWRTQPNTDLYQHQAEMVQAWLEQVYLPPTTAAVTYLTEHARLMDASSRMRLDRRTLYSGLLMEWLNLGTSSRKFLEASTSQSLQAALSLATQPEWRQCFPRPSGIRLYADSTSEDCTLAMQETIAMALAHSLGAGMVILDDAILESVRQQLILQGYSDDELRPAALIEALLELAREGKLNGKTGGLISTCMDRDLEQGLDDPFDDRAAASCRDMVEWEEAWGTTNDDDNNSDNALPLVIFVRTQSSPSLLKSKSAVDLLLQECNSTNGINMVILGKGIDARTEYLPDSQERPESQDMVAQQAGNSAPWFGFSPQNQNASGKNDPEGSRRFNIFLARTVDQNGTPGILGAIAPPQAGNLFPHMMAMQARERLQHQNEDSPAKAELERWAQLLQHQMQTNGGAPLPPPQFFNASLASPFGIGENPQFSSPSSPPPPPPEVIQKALEQAMAELLDRLAQENDDGEPSSELSPDLQKAFAQVLRNESLRRGIAENLARAAPALSDPKCQGVMLSVYVPPPPHHMNSGKLPGTSNGKPGNNMAGWFQKILHNQEGEDNEEEDGRRKSRQKRVRTMAAAAAVMAAKDAENAKGNEKSENKADRNLAKLESLCRAIPVEPPTDPVRAKSWENWIARERGSVIFRLNRRALNEELHNRVLSIQEHTGTRGAGSSLRQMLSVRDVSEDMEDIVKCAVELEAAKTQRHHETPTEMHNRESNLDPDITLSQLVENGTRNVQPAPSGKNSKRIEVQYLHPSSLETALTMTCRISPSPTGGLFLSSTPASHRSREEIASLAQDKHERALISQVVSPQDIGVTYDMIGGLANVKELLRQSITYPLKFPHLYSEGIAREAVKGVLLFGPPGTGKTMLAKAVATEGGASFLSVDASSVENKWLGESEKNAKAVFTLARRLAPCVIFIDEVDSLLSSREGTSDDSAHGTLTSVKTTMMSEWDGLNSGTNGSGDRVVVIGSTNRPFDLDEAVLRRFPRRILVDLPDLETRTEILEVTLAENRIHPDVNFTKIAERLEGYTGSDIKEVCREAVVQISHEQAKLLDQGFGNSREDLTQGSLQRLRPVTNEDFETALNKLKRSVSEKGRELARVWEWNDEYGEVKKETKNHLSHLMNMYL